MKNKAQGLADTMLFLSAIIFFVTAYILFLIDNFSPIKQFILTNNIQIVQIKWGLIFLEGVSVAALIGGLSDWYGVTSIFGRPLHIRFKTEIAIERRMGLIESIKDFVSEEIMSEKNIENALIDIKPVQVILEHIKNKNEGLIRLFSKLAGKLATEIIIKIDGKKIYEPLSESLAEHFRMHPPSDYLSSFLRKIGEKDNFEKLITASAGELTDVFKLRSVRTLVENGIDFAINNYKGDMKRRGFIASQLGRVLKKSVIENAEKELRIYLEPESHGLAALKKKYLEAVESFNSDETLKASIDKGIVSYLTNSDLIKVKIEEILAGIKNDNYHLDNKIATIFERLISLAIEEFAANKELRVKIEAFIIKKVIAYADNYKDKIRDLVETNLTSMSERELFYYLRDNTAAELQYIRLNGMLFGTIIGVLVSIIRISLEVIK